MDIEELVCPCCGADHVLNCGCDLNDDGTCNTHGKIGSTKIRKANVLPHKPTIVCLCGSTRFSAAFRAAALSETLAGRIVLTIGDMMQSDDDMGLTEEDKARLDELHLRKIDLADEVLILNVGGYIGASTMRELGYATKQRKVIRFLEDNAQYDTVN